MTNAGHSPPPESDERFLREIRKAMLASHTDAIDIRELRRKTMKQLKEAPVASLILVNESERGKELDLTQNPIIQCHRNRGRKERVQITIPDTSFPGSYRTRNGTLVCRSESEQSEQAAALAVDHADESRHELLQMPLTLSADSGAAIPPENGHGNTDIADRDSVSDDATDLLLDDCCPEECEFELILDEGEIEVHEEDFRLASADVQSVPPSWIAGTSLPSISGCRERVGPLPRVAPPEIQGNQAGQEIRRAERILGAEGARNNPLPIRGQGLAQGNTPLLRLESPEGLSANLSDQGLSVWIDPKKIPEETLLVAELTTESADSRTERRWVVDFITEDQAKRLADGTIRRDVKIHVPDSDDATISLTVRPFNAGDVWMLWSTPRERFLSGEPTSSLTVRRTSDTQWTLTLFQHDLDEIEKCNTAALMFRLLRYDGGAH